MDTKELAALSIEEMEEEIMRITSSGNMADVATVTRLSTLSSEVASRLSAASVADIQDE